MPVSVSGACQRYRRRPFPCFPQSDGCRNPPLWLPHTFLRKVFDYINKLYDTSMGAQKDAVEDGYKKSIMQLNASQKNTQGQTADYLKRAYVEGNRATGNMNTASGAGGATVSGMGAGANVQARLTMGNQNQANATVLNQQQAAADAEYNRQRQLKSDWYAAQIKKAQADNDMNRAQALYDAAKAEEEQLRSLRQSGALLMAGKGDNSILDAIGRGEQVKIDETTPTWDGVIKNEEAINKIYDAQLEAQRIQAQAEMDKSLVLLGQFGIVLVYLAGGFFHLHNQLLAHACVLGADAEFVGGELLLDELPDGFGNLLQAAGGIIAAALPSVLCVELASGGFGGFLRGSGGGLVVGQPEGGEYGVVFVVDGLHGFLVSAPVGVVQHGKAAILFLEFVQGGAVGEVFHGVTSCVVGGLVCLCLYDTST